MNRGFAVVAALACASLACASGPPQPRGTAWLPAPAPGLGRLVLYHTNDTDLTMFHPMLTVDGAPVGELPVGTFLHADRSPGIHEVGVQPQPDVSAFGDQDPTQPVSVELTPGKTSYLQVGVVSSPISVGVSLTPMDAGGAQQDLADLTEAAPPGAD